MKKKIYLAMLAVCFALTASACGDGGAVITDGTKTEGAADIVHQNHPAKYPDCL